MITTTPSGRAPPRLPQVAHVVPNVASSLASGTGTLLAPCSPTRATTSRRFGDFARLTFVARLEIVGCPLRRLLRRRLRSEKGQIVSNAFQ